MHTFCYVCLLPHFTLASVTCPTCDRPVLEAPVCDYILESCLEDYICNGFVVKSRLQPGKNVAAKESEYCWKDVIFQP
jgi:hypothetical protein